MRSTLYILFFVLFLCPPADVQAQSVVDRVTFRVTDENTVVVRYQLNASHNRQQYHISLWASTDNGDNFFLASTTAGDIGLVIGEGRKEVLWDVLADTDIFEGENCVFKVRARAVGRPPNTVTNNQSDNSRNSSGQSTKPPTRQPISRDNERGSNDRMQSRKPNINGVFWSAGLISGSFVGEAFDQKANANLIRPNGGIRLGADFVGSPFLMRIGIFTERYNIDSTALASQGPALHLGGHISANFAPQYGFFVPHAGVGYQMSMLALSDDFNQRLKTSSTFWEIGVAIHLKQFMILGIEYRQALSGGDNSGAFVADSRAWRQAVVYLAVGF